MFAKLRAFLTRPATPTPTAGSAIDEIFGKDTDRNLPMLAVMTALDRYVAIGDGLAAKIDANLVSYVRARLACGIEPATKLEALALCVGRGESILSRFLYHPEVKRDDLERALEDTGECRAEIAAILLWDSNRLTQAERWLIDHPQDVTDETRVQASKDRIDRTTRAATYRFEMLSR